MTTRRWLELRLKYLWTFELIGAAMFSFLVWWFWWPLKLGPLAVGGLALVILLLVQGSFYWYLKLRVVQRWPVLSSRAFVQLFTAFRRIDVALLWSGLVAGVGWAVVSTGASGMDRAFGAGLWALAAGEYINYHWRQLMYDSPTELAWLIRNRTLKVARLRRDLEAGRL